MSPTLTRGDFEQLLTDQRCLVELLNDLEYQLYQLGEVAADEPIAGCQQAAGALISALRHYLFRQDQIVLPVFDSLTADSHS